MKDFTLSLLSRGYGHIVQTDGDPHNARLEVCFEPEDYFNWKSQDALLRLSSSGRLLNGVDPSLPKTYSTRRGPLILYSEDLALPHYHHVNGQDHQRSGQEVEFQLCTLKDLTGAILAYEKKQPKIKGRATVSHPWLSVAKYTIQGAQTHLLSTIGQGDRRQTVLNQHTKEVRDKSAISQTLGDLVSPMATQVRYQPRFLCSPRPLRIPPGPLPPQVKPWSHRVPRDSGLPTSAVVSGGQVTSETWGLEDRGRPRGMDRERAHKVVDIPRVQMSPIPETEPNDQENNTRQTWDQMNSDHLIHSKGHKGGQWKCSVIVGDDEKRACSLGTACVETSCGCSHPSCNDHHGAYGGGARQHGAIRQRFLDTGAQKVNVTPILHLPPITLPLNISPTQREDQGVKAETADLQMLGDTVPKLPDIHQSTISLESIIRTLPDRDTPRKILVLLPQMEQMEQTERNDTLRPPDGPNDLEQDAMTQCDDGKHKKEPVREVKFLGFDQGHLMWPETMEDKEQSPSVGTLPPLVGRRGPGKQSSMAFYRLDPHDPAESTETQAGTVRGSLPAELRECQEGRMVGTLVMGPDGEIIRLSVWDPADTKDHPELHNITQEHALNVLSSEEAVRQIWTVPPQDEATHTGEYDSEIKTENINKESICDNDVRDEQRESDKNQERLMRLKPKGKINSEAQTQERQRLKNSVTIETAHNTGRSEAEQREERRKNVREERNEEGREDRGQGGRGESRRGERDEETKGLRAEARGNPASPLPKNAAPDINPQKPAARTPPEDPALDASIRDISRKVKLKDQKGQWKETGHMKLNRTAGTNTVQDTQVRGGKKKGERNHGVSGRREPETEPVNEDMKIQDGLNVQDTATGPKKSPTKIESKRQKGGSAKPQGTAMKKAKKKVKSQPEFVVGKPQRRQETRSTERAERKVPDVQVNEADQECEHEQCCTTDEHAVDVNEDVDVIITEGDRTPTSQSHCSVNDSSSQGRDSAGSDAVSPAHSGHLSCAQPSAPSVVMTTEHHMTDPVPSAPSSVQGKVVDEAANHRQQKAAVLAEKAERRRLEVERKRREREEEKRRQQEREEREERLRLELEEERRQREEEARLKKLREEDERRRREEEEMERKRREHAEREREKRQQEQLKRQMERIQRLKQEEEERRAAEMERQRLEEERRKEEERQRLQEMEESERREYLRRQQEEEEERKRREEERKKREEEAARLAVEEARRQAEMFARHRAALERQLQFQRGLCVEAEGLDQTQGISRPWVFSYFALLDMLGLADTAPSQQELAKDAL